MVAVLLSSPSSPRCNAPPAIHVLAVDDDGALCRSSVDSPSALSLSPSPSAAPLLPFYGLGVSRRWESEL